MKKDFIKLIFANIFIFISLIISLEIIAGYYISLSSKKKSRSNLRHLIISHLEKQNSISRNNRMENIIDLTELNKNIYPSYLYNPMAHKIDNQNFWFSHPKDSEIIYCDEGSGLIKFKTNNLGFREVSSQDLTSEIDILVLGDSFAEGACVDMPYDIPSQLALLNKKNVLNLGRSGSGPLFQLALLKEILEHSKSRELTFKKDAKLIWIIFTGNDVKNLAYEKITSLQRYIEDYNINYFKKLKSSNINFNKFFKEVFDDPINNKKLGRKGFIFNPESIEGKNTFIDFGRVFQEMKEISVKNNFDLKIISLTNHKSKSRKELMKKTDNSITILCKKYNVDCKAVNLSKINKSNRPHLDEKGYKKVSEIINEFSF